MLGVNKHEKINTVSYANVELILEFLCEEYHVLQISSTICCYFINETPIEKHL